MIELHAPPACNCAAALQVDQGGSGSSIRGLAINGGVTTGSSERRDERDDRRRLHRPDGGRDTDGADEKLNSAIYVSGGGANTIGGPNPADHNVIGNTSTVILVTGIDLDGTVANTIVGNAIGVGTDGTTAVPNADGIALFNGASNNTISSNVISGNAYYGITIADATTSSNSIVANDIGTLFGGTAPLANGSGGILVSGGKSNVIGSTPVGVNIISGNTGDGVHIVGGNGTSIVGNIVGLRADGVGTIPNTGAGIYVSGAATAGTTIRGNIASGNIGIGISIDGSAGAGGAPTGTVIAGNRAGINAGPVGNTDYGNGGDGIRLWQVTNTLVGGTTAADRNIASGNVGHGIHVLGGGNNTIQGNYAGTNLAGAGAIKNDIDGIAIDESSNNLVGGTAAGAGNLASGNQNQGISVFTFSGSGAAASGNRVFGNTAGLAADGTTAMPNGGEGIRIYGGANNQIGGVDAGQANEVARNLGAGITVYLATATGNAIRGNKVHDNVGVGIGLSADGATVGVVPNDVGDGDVGGNNLQNFPVLTDVIADGKSVTVAGTLDTNAGVVNVDYYANTACDGSGNGEGATYLGTTQLTAGQGATPFNDVLTSPAAAAVAAGQFITATATDKNGNTSGYSACFAASGNAPASA